MKKQSNKLQGARKRVQGGGETALGAVRMPKQLQYELNWNVTLRFYSGQNNADTAITFKNILDSVLVAGTATLGYNLFDFVRIKRLELWATGITAGGVTPAVQSCSVEWSGIGAASAGSGRAVSETTVGSAAPLHLVTRPPKGSRAADFQVSSTDRAFEIRASGVAFSAVVDLTVEFRNSNGVTPLAVANAITGATPGEIYFGGLDGLRTAGTAWPSVFNPSI